MIANFFKILQSLKDMCGVGVGCILTLFRLRPDNTHEHSNNYTRTGSNINQPSSKLETKLRPVNWGVVCLEISKKILPPFNPNP